MTCACSFPWLIVMCRGGVIVEVPTRNRGFMLFDDNSFTAFTSSLEHQRGQFRFNKGSKVRSISTVKISGGDICGRGEVDSSMDVNKDSKFSHCSGIGTDLRITGKLVAKHYHRCNILQETCYRMDLYKQCLKAKQRGRSQDSISTVNFTGAAMGSTSYVLPTTTLLKMGTKLFCWKHWME